MAAFRMGRPPPAGAGGGKDHGDEGGGDAGGDTGDGGAKATSAAEGGDCGDAGGDAREAPARASEGGEDGGDGGGEGEWAAAATAAAAAAPPRGAGGGEGGGESRGQDAFRAVLSETSSFRNVVSENSSLSAWSLLQKSQQFAKPPRARRWYPWASQDLQRALNDATFEAKEVNFVELCRQFYPGKKPSELSCHEQVALIRYALRKRGNFLIDPHGNFMKHFDIIIALSLVFTGIVTPYEVIFLKTVKWQSSVFFANRFVDLVFFVDIAMQFFLKVQVRQPGKRGTVMLKDRRQIRRRYLKSWFLTDVVGILPFDIAFLMIPDYEAYSGVKILRCVRLLRLAKLVRIIKGSRLVLRWQSYFGFSFASQKMAKFIVILLLSSHWMACLWGFAGLTFGASLCDARGARVVGEIAPEDVSWVTTLFVDSGSPDDPCDPWHIYMASLYWSVMTITSIGFGDISPVRNAEYMVCVLCMLFGGVLWAYTIGSVCSIMTNVDPVETQFETKADLLNAMMRESGVRESRRQYYREYLRESRVLDKMNHFREVASKFSPQLKGELLLHTCRSWTKSVFYLRYAPERVLMALAETTSVHFYSKNEELHQQCLCLVEQGTLASAGRILTPGEAFNIDCIVAEKIWRRFARRIALTYSMILALDGAQLLEVGFRDPKLRRTLRHAAARIAMQRCMQACAARARAMIGTAGDGGAAAGEEGWSLTEVFDLIREEHEEQMEDSTRAVVRATVRALTGSPAMQDVRAGAPRMRSALLPAAPAAIGEGGDGGKQRLRAGVASPWQPPEPAPEEDPPGRLEALERRLNEMQDEMQLRMQAQIQAQFQEVRTLLRETAARDAPGM